MQAVAQSDGVVFIYKLGAAWNEKKSICNKFLVPSGGGGGGGGGGAPPRGGGVSVTCVVWPPLRSDIFYGLSDGKV